tara:strand:+ start:873 stop:1679 length:807 start_codon:yes stop_codon:yes gene_type:complete
MARFIINCDDFGQDRDTNQAIQMAFQAGLISSTTLLANMAGFNDAITMIHEGSIPIHAVGIHLNLTQGKPLTNEIKNESRFCKNDLFHGQVRQSPVFFLTTSEKRAVRVEIGAQILKLREHGVPISHADGHHHIHTEWGIFNAIKDILKEKKIDKVRISRTLGVKGEKRKTHFKLIYKVIFNRYLRRSSFSTCEEMGEFTDYFNSIVREGANEIMVHFVQVQNKFELDGNNSHAYAQEVSAFTKEHELISYSDLDCNGSRRMSSRFLG